MDEADRTQSTSLIVPASETASGSGVREEVDDDDRRPPQPFPQRSTAVDDAYHPHFQQTNNDETVQSFSDDTWSCVVVVITFWFFVSMTLIWGVYGTSNLQLGPNSSIMIKPNPLFVEQITVEEIDTAIGGPMLYGLYRNPPLDIVATWSEAYKTSLPANTHKEWTYYFNAGSEISISYNVNSLSSSSLVLVITQGSDGLAQWLEDPSYPNGAFSWNLIHGNGTIWQDIRKSSSYHVAVGNLNSEMVEAHLNIKIKAFLYSTNEAYYKCRITQNQCGLSLFFPGGNVALLTSPSQRPDTADGVWTVKLSYGPRWITYLLGIGGTCFLVFLAQRILNNLHRSRQDTSRAQLEDAGSERFPMLSDKHDDNLSLGSSYCSLSQDEDAEEPTSSSTLDGKPVKDSEQSDMRHLCAICFDAPRDCFFLPCGHCLSCFECGTKIAEAAGTCPVCRRRMKKVKKIYTV
ncbi:E3 ubiquitin-protein ligase APD2-like isoform X1 [Ipomoea triloba]|uniref:E3 ubiquitin-protein ligase APD2-like isoform X1 n=1 Tax=Ipomoea triloba TaxID=35885 RepID=UPI00125E7CEB|nr:E3 ubiquitin-protein ligase APD2-like isoform X1 [Ipomoea triloba]